MSGETNGRISQASILPWLGVVLAVGSAFLSVANPRDDVKQTRQESREDTRAVEARLMGEINGIKAHLSDRLTTAEHAEFARRVSESIGVVQGDLTRVRVDMVPRSEHQQHWAEIGERIGTVREGLNDLRKDFVSIAPPADRMKGLEAQIVAMQARLDAIIRMGAQQPSAQVQITPSQGH